MEQPQAMQTAESQMNEQRVVISASLDVLSQSAADQIMECAKDAIKDHGAFYFALSGGATPRHLHQILADHANRKRIAWEKVHVYFGDERNVPHDHPDSNYRMAVETLLSRVPIPAGQVHAIPTGCDDMQVCADRYAAQLTTMPQQNGVPCFDLIILGIGADGHTASLFPTTTILEEADRSVAAVFVPKLDSWRISLTYPVLNQAKHILVLVSGSNKEQVLYEIFNEPERNYPVQRIRNSHLEWFVDTSAAARLIESDVGISG